MVLIMVCSRSANLFTQSLITSYGTAAIAANATGSTIELLATIPAAAMGLALTTVVGQCVGAGDYQSVKEYSWKLMKWAYVMLWGLNIVIIFMTPTIAKLVQSVCRGRSLGSYFDLVS